MKIAILGGGMAGVATAYHLLHSGKSVEVVLFDANGIGNGASAVPQALIHCYAGARARLSFRAHDGWDATFQLISAAEAAMERPVAQHSGVLRLAVSQQQRDDFAVAAASYEDVRWCSAEECQELCPGICGAPGIWLEQAALVDMKAYLTGLWQCCEALGARLKRQSVGNLQSLGAFDTIVVATGAATTALPECSHLPITPLKGQMLLLRSPAKLPRCPIASHILLLPQAGSDTILVGSTYERHYRHTAADLAEAEAALLPKAIALFPPLAQAEVLGIFTALRASAPLHRPLVERLSAHCWIFTGLGSKGLLWHALLAKELAQTILEH